jgi:hypothetical protein
MKAVHTGLMRIPVAGTFTTADAPVAMKTDVVATGTAPMDPNSKAFLQWYQSQPRSERRRMDRVAARTVSKHRREQARAQSR